MSKAIILVLLSVMFSLTAEAANHASIMRGGYGFLFGDTNRFTNPGQFSKLKGFAAEADYTYHKTTGTNTVTPSFVFGNGRFGLGAYGSRTGGTLTDANDTTDTAGAGLGFNFAKERISMGFGIRRSLEAQDSNDGTISGTITLHPGNKGLSIGGGVSRTLNSSDGVNVQTAIGAIGYAFNPMVAIEASVLCNDTSDTSNLTISGDITLSGKSAYLGGHVANHRKASYSEAEGRVGVILGSVDMSVHGGKSFLTGHEYDLGASIRIRL